MAALEAYYVSQSPQSYSENLDALVKANPPYLSPALIKPMAKGYQFAYHPTPGTQKVHQGREVIVREGYLSFVFPGYMSPGYRKNKHPFGGQQKSSKGAAGGQSRQSAASQWGGSACDEGITGL